MDERHHGEVEELTEQVRVCEGVLAEEKKQHRTTQESLAQLKQELEIHRDELAREKTELMEQVKVSEKYLQTYPFETFVYQESPFNFFIVEQRSRECCSSNKTDFFSGVWQSRVGVQTS